MAYTSTFDRALSMSDNASILAPNDQWFESNEIEQGASDVYASEIKLIIGLTLGAVILVLTCTLTCYCK